MHGKVCSGSHNGRPELGESDRDEPGRSGEIRQPRCEGRKRRLEDASERLGCKFRHQELINRADTDQNQGRRERSYLDIDGLHQGRLDLEARILVRWKFRLTRRDRERVRLSRDTSSNPADTARY